MKFEIIGLENLTEAVKEFCDFLSDADICEDLIFNSRLALSELIENTFLHSKIKKANVEGCVNENYIECKVYTDYRPPKESVCSSVFSEHGRGLFLVDQVCDERTYTDDGAIQIKIKIQSK